MYFGPDVLLPLGAAVATIAGVAMMFWQRIKQGFALVAKLFRRGDHSQER